MLISRYLIRKSAPPPKKKTAEHYIIRRKRECKRKIHKCNRFLSPAPNQRTEDREPTRALLSFSLCAIPFLCTVSSNFLSSSFRSIRALRRALYPMPDCVFFFFAISFYLCWEKIFFFIVNIISSGKFKKPQVYEKNKSFLLEKSNFFCTFIRIFSQLYI